MTENDMENSNGLYVPGEEQYRIQALDHDYGK